MSQNYKPGPNDRGPYYINAQHNMVNRAGMPPPGGPVAYVGGPDPKHNIAMQVHYQQAPPPGPPQPLYQNHATTVLQGAPQMRNAPRQQIIFNPIQQTNMQAAQFPHFQPRPNAPQIFPGGNAGMPYTWYPHPQPPPTGYYYHPAQLARPNQALANQMAPQMPPQPHMNNMPPPPPEAMQQIPPNLMVTQSSAPVQLPISNSKKVHKNRLRIIDPDTGRDVIEDMYQSGGRTSASPDSTPSEPKEPPETSGNPPVKLEALAPQLVWDDASALQKTPVVSAISDGPSVILKVQQKKSSKVVTITEKSTGTESKISLDSEEADQKEPSVSVAPKKEDAQSTNKRSTSTIGVTAAPQEIVDGTAQVYARPEKTIEPVLIDKMSKLEIVQETPKSEDAATTQLTEDEPDKAAAAAAAIVEEVQPIENEHLVVVEEKIEENPPADTPPKVIEPSSLPSTVNTSVPPPPLPSSPPPPPTPVTASVVVVVEKPPPKLLISYDNGQWSPANPTGRKYYRIEQLKELCKFVKPTLKPIIPANIQRILSPSSMDSFKIDSMQFNAMPKFPQQQQRGGNFSTKRLSQQGNKQNQMGPKGGHGRDKDQIKIISLSLHEDVQLKESDNAWKPKFMVKQDDMPPEEKALKVLTDSFRSVLNKLTPNNFDTLVREVRKFEISCAAHLGSCIELVFEKAISEPTFSSTYAKMCKELSDIHVMDKQKTFLFKNCLINQCQHEFEKAHMIKSAHDKRDLVAKETDPAKKEELRAQLDDEDYRARKRAVGTITFIGELYKIDLLTNKIMLKCISLLLDEQTRDEDSIECLCKLLTTIGGLIDTGKNVLTATMKTLEAIKRGEAKPHCQSRVKFMIKDVEELRSRGWVPRNKANNPKTMGEIQKEHDNEHRKIQMMNYQPQGASGGSGMMSRRGDDRRPGGGMYNKPEKLSFDSKKIDYGRLSNPESNNTKQLGTATFFQQWNNNNNKYSNQSSDAESGNEMPPPSMLPGPVNMMPSFGASGGDMYRGSLERDRGDRYAATNHRYEESGSRRGSRGSGGMRSRDSSITKSGSYSHSTLPGNLSRQNYHSSGTGSARSSLERKEKQLQQQQQSHSVPTANIPKRASLKLEYEEPDEKAMADGEAILKRIHNDFLESKDDQYATKEFEKIKRSHRWAILRQTMLTLLDHNSAERSSLSHLCLVFLKCSASPPLVPDELKRALKDYFEYVVDLTPDYPLICEYTAEYLTPFLLKGVIKLSDLVPLAESLIKAKYGGRLITAVLNDLEKRHSSAGRDLWQQSGLHWIQFAPDDEISQIVASFSESKKHVLKEDRLTWERVEHLLQLALQREDSDQQIRNLVDDLLRKVDASAGDRRFIRSFSTIAFNHGIDPKSNGYVINMKRFDRARNLLHYYIDNQAEREIQCLYALQQLMNKLEHPQGLLIAICQALLNSDTVSRDGFLQWRDCTDPQEQAQKGVAMVSLHQFYIQLAEQDSTESSCDETTN